MQLTQFQAQLASRELRGKASDQALILVGVAKKAIREIQEVVVKLLEDKLGGEGALEVAKKLTEGYYTHDYPVTVEEARKRA